VISFFFGGVGMVLQEACANGFIAILSKDSEYKMGIVHATYVAPLSATYFAQTTHWANHYLVSSCLAVANLVLIAVFRFQGQDGRYLREVGEIVPDKAADEEVYKGKFTQMMTYKAVHLLSIFLVVYIGVEVTVGGWSASFLIFVRGGGPASGYVSTGFFGGMHLLV